jgi:hypothetical protein
MRIGNLYNLDPFQLVILFDPQWKHILLSTTILYVLQNVVADIRVCVLTSSGLNAS